MNSQSHLRRKYTYLHFSSPVRLEVKPPPRQARCGLPQRNRQHLQLSSAEPTLQDLAINGVTVPRSGQYRRPKMEIHVYIPSGKKVADAESLDEGFLEKTETEHAQLGGLCPVKTVKWAGGRW
uniref:Uncharacterized protein n=1 Tax=Sphaerodactylus townsendi TaxID=933632 RepID=A0ACB8FS61_9SAUR